MAKKNYATTEGSVEQVKYTKSKEPTNEFCMRGEVLMNLWGGGQGSYPVWPGNWTQEDGIVTKKVIWDNMSDDGHGCESFASCNVTVFQIVEVTHSGDPKTTYTEEVEIFSGKVYPKDAIDG